MSEASYEPGAVHWTATANEIIRKVCLIHQDFKKLLGNNDNPK